LRRKIAASVDVHFTIGLDDLDGNLCLSCETEEGTKSGSACGAVVAGRTLAQLRAIDEAIDAPQQMIAGNVIFEPELIEQALLHQETLAHHGLILR
jgi:hypothetical protein